MVGTQGGVCKALILCQISVKGPRQPRGGKPRIPAAELTQYMCTHILCS